MSAVLRRHAKPSPASGRGWPGEAGSDDKSAVADLRLGEGSRIHNLRVFCVWAPLIRHASHDPFSRTREKGGAVS